MDRNNPDLRGISKRPNPLSKLVSDAARNRLADTEEVLVRTKFSLVVKALQHFPSRARREILASLLFDRAPFEAWH